MTVRRGRAHGPKGFTLIEVMVAVFILAILALLSWRGIDGMVRTQSMTRSHADALLRSQAALEQWIADLNALQETGVVSALAFDGLVLRMTRTDAEETAVDSPGIRVVAWARLSAVSDAPGPQWMRWQSAPIRAQEELRRAWDRAGQWGRGTPVSDPDSRDSAVRLMGLDDWQLYYYRGEGWTNPQSAVGNESPGSIVSSEGQIPDGVRLQLQPTSGQALAGRITRDWVRLSLGARR